ncbi:MAG: AtpZ/AtpI family protein [Epulopiscium sp.]|nr:AtpZ/AtpI family protein [Candidatus Epulonipiscium sp.]
MKKKAEMMRMFSLVTHMGLMMALPIIGCIWLGSFLDRKLNTGVVFLIIFTVLGVFSAFRNLFMLAQQPQGKSDPKEEDPNE